MKVPVDLGTVQRTLLVPLWARAREAQEPVPLLRDPSARAVCSQLDFDFTPLARAHASRLGCCVRGELVDAWVRAFLGAHGEATVVELGCGLNARFERVDDGRVRWFDLDLPDVIALRRRFFRDEPRRTMLASSVLEEDWLETVARGARGPLLFVSEGMFVYLDDAEVRAVFTRLTQRFPGSQLVFDAMTPWVLRHQKHHDAMRHFEARFTWSVSEARAVEAWHPGIRLEASERFYDLLYARAGRLPLGLRWLGRGLGLLCPPVKRSYTVNRARLGTQPA